MARKSNTPPAETARDLSTVELKFIDEFLMDRDPYLAALRTGVARVVAKRKVQEWMSDSRILRAIQLKTDTADLGKMVSPQRIMAGFMDVAFNREAPPAARNTALRELASLMKMYTSDEDEKGSGVVLIPVAGSLEEWKAMSMEAQKKLKEDVRD